MRNYVVLAGLVVLSGCGGSGSSGPQSAGSPLGGTSSNGTQETLAAPAQARTYVGVGGTQVYKYVTDDRDIVAPNNPLYPNRGQQAQVYASKNGTVRDSTISIAYDPRDAIFSLIVQDPNSGAATTTRFQDPASRTDFGGGKEPQWGTPNLNDSGIRFLQAGDGNPISPYSHSGTGFINPGTNSTPASGASGSSIQSSTLFYQVPDATNKAGTKTKYVTFAGYLRNSQSFNDVALNGITIDQNSWHLERGAFAFGIKASDSAVPVSGNGRYEGGMIATAVINPSLDEINVADRLPTYFQWIYGTSKIDVDFAAGTVKSQFDGTVYAPQIDRYSTPNGAPPPNLATVPAGATFTASGTGTINLINTGGFKGVINSASFSNTTTGGALPINIAGQGGFDGAFYGPATGSKLTPDQVEVGGGFNVAGATPDQRIDVVGAFAGARTGPAQ